MNQKQIALSEFMQLNEKLMDKFDKLFHSQVKNLINCELTLLQLRACMIISDHKIVKMSEFANAMNLKTSGATQLIDKLVELGEVVRIYDPSDRRTVKIKLTAKTSNKMIKIKNIENTILADVFSPLELGELQILNQIITKVI